MDWHKVEWLNAASVVRVVRARLIVALSGKR